MDNEERAVAGNEILFGSGWGRVLPSGAIAVILALVVDGPMTRQDLDARLRRSPNSPDGLASFAWDPLEPFTDEQLAELDETWGSSDERQQSAAEVNVELEAERAARLEEQDRFRAAVGLPSDHTLGGALDLMVACGVLRSDGDVIDLVAVPPLPSEVLPLSPEQVAEEDALRWERLYEPLAQAILSLFDPLGEQIEELVTDLGRLARDLESDPEAVRAAIAKLVGEGDFAVEADVETLRENQTFTLRVDWEEFARRRISIRRVGDDEWPT